MVLVIFLNWLMTILSKTFSALSQKNDKEQAIGGANMEAERLMF